MVSRVDDPKKENAGMILFKACLRCLGDLYVVSEIYGSHAQRFPAWAYY